MKLLILLFVITFILLCSLVRADEIPVWKILMAEAVSEGYEGMYAVACVIRNRGGDLSGFLGAKRKDLDDFCKRQGQYYINLAQEIERCVFEENSPSNIGNATHFEAIEIYGEPWWAKDMIVTCKIGEHTFYEEK